MARIVPQHGEIVQPSADANLRRSVVVCAVGAALVVGLVARLQGIGSSLWVDEFGTLWVVEKSLRDAAQRAIQVQGQTPLYYTLVWGTLKVFGESEFALRSVSVAAVLTAAAVLWRTSRAMAGDIAGLGAAILFWFSPAVITVSASARPYALGLLCAAVSVLGFVDACRTGRRRGRVLFVFGSAALFWTHYLMSLMLGGLVAGYVLSPALRSKYPWRALFVDLVFVGILLLPTIPQWLALTARRGAMNWSTTGPTFDAFKPLVPMIAIGAAAALWRRRDPDRLRAGLVLSLWLAVVCQIGVLWLATLVGVNLLVQRFLLVAIVPAAIVAGVGLAGFGLTVGAVVVAGALLLAAPEVRATHQVIGSFSGAGFQQWREAVDDLASLERVPPGAPVLYRSGFVEDDAPPLNELAPMSLAPLRSPGRVAPQFRILPLPFRWSNPDRERYFDAEIAPQLDRERLFFFLGPPITEPHVGSYADNVAAFVRSRWPNRFHVTSVGAFRGLTLLRFSQDD